MSKKYLFFILVAVLLSMAALSSALKHLQTKSLQNVLGSYSFANTKNNLFKLKKIKLAHADGREMTFYYENGIWYFEEAADYFVKDEAIQNFYDMVKNSVLIERVEKTSSEDSKLNVKTFDENGEVLDDVYLFGSGHSIMSYPDNKFAYKISHTENISNNPPDWLPSPLLKINKDLILGLNVNGKYADKEALDENEPFSDNLKEFFDALKNVEYEGIVSDELFDEEYAEIVQEKEILIYLAGGLNYRLQIYSDGENYYARIFAEREVIAKKEVNGIIEVQNMYYRGWTFLLTPEQGKTLFNFDFEQ